MMPDTKSTRRAHALDRPLHTILRVGTIAAGVAMAAGLLLSLLGRGPLPPATEALSAPRTWYAAMRLEPGALASVGIGLLVLTPFARVVAAIVGFAASRQTRFAVVATVVLSLMIASILLGTG